MYNGNYINTHLIAQINTYNANCSPASGHVCELVVHKPKYALFSF